MLLCLTVVILSFNFILQTLRDVSVLFVLLQGCWLVQLIGSELWVNHLRGTRSVLRWERTKVQSRDISFDVMFCGQVDRGNRSHFQQGHICFPSSHRPADCGPYRSVTILGGVKRPEAAMHLVLRFSICLASYLSRKGIRRYMHATNVFACRELILVRHY